MNSFGERFIFTTFGESHGKAIGCVVDGVPAGIYIDEEYIQAQLDRRKPGQNEFATSRKEGDKVEILSGVFEGKSTGTPIAMVIFNQDQKSKDYTNIKDIFRPGHADFTYFHKYGIRDYRGGGRSSARETAARVAAGAIAKLMLRELNIEVLSGVYAIGGIEAERVDFKYAKDSEIYSLDRDKESSQKEAILKAKKSHDSIGGVAFVRVVDAPIGLGEPIYYKIDAKLADAMVSINGVKGVEIGLGAESSKVLGSQNNDPIKSRGFSTNYSGGVLGGITNGENIDIKVYFKPTPSIFQPQQSIDIENREVECLLKGRHDPCIAIRGSIVAEAMAALVVCDMLLLNLGRTIQNLKLTYNKKT